MSVQIKIGVKVTGYPDLDNVLKRMPPTRFKNIMQAAMNTASKPIQSAMKAGAPKWSGALAKTIGFRRLRTPRKGFIIAGRVGTLGRKGKGKKVPNPLPIPPNAKRKYSSTISVGARPLMLQWPESGVTRHTIKPKRGKVLVFKSKQGKWIFAKKISHPGYAGKRFMARSIAGNQRKLMTDFNKSVAIATKNHIVRFLKRKKIKIV